MRAELKAALLFAALSLIPSGFVLYGLYSLPEMGQIGIEAPTILYGFVPMLYPFSMFFQALPDGLRTDEFLAILVIVLVFLNALMYGAVGYGLVVLFRKWNERVDTDGAGSMAHHDVH